MKLPSFRANSRTVLLLVLGLPACGSMDRSDAGGGSHGPTRAGDGRSLGDEDRREPGDGRCETFVAEVSTCRERCGDSADCAVEATAGGAFGSDNYRCEAGACRYGGCRSDLECATTMASTGRTYRCASNGCSEEAYCQLACARASDCATEQTTGGAFGPESYRCVDGLCEWRGCPSDAACEASFAATGRDYRCRELGGGTPVCIQACVTPADCAYASGGIYDASRFACDQGACAWRGCGSDGACAVTFQNDDYVCR